MVYAKDPESALDAAHEVVHEKLGYRHKGGPFDYYVDFTESPKKGPGMIAEEAVASALSNNDCPVLALFGKSRWGPVPPVLQVSSARFPIDDKRGLDMVNSAMENNRKVFKRSMEYMRYHIASYTNDQLFDGIESSAKIEIGGEEINIGSYGFQCLCEDASGNWPDPGAYLYNFRGRPISRPAELRRILNDSDSDPWYVDPSEGADPNWGAHVWTQPLWVVPFDVHY